MLKSILLLLLSMLSIQFAASQAKQLFAIFGVAGTSTLRLVFAGLMLAMVFKPWRVKPGKTLLLYGFSLGLMNLTFYFALQRIPLGIAVALEFIGPLSVAIFYSRKKVDFIWAMLATLGIILILPKTDTPAALDPMGIFLALLAGLFWGLYIIFGKRTGNAIKGGAAASAGMIYAALIVLPVGVGLDADKLYEVSAFPLALMVAFFGSALPYSLEMVALRNLPSQTFGVLMSLEPAIAALMGLYFLNETLTINQWIAVFCVIISSLGSTLTASMKKTVVNK
ncbi:MAG: EamA family transporter [Bacteriovoracia bacterium]